MNKLLRQLSVAWLAIAVALPVRLSSQAAQPASPHPEERSLPAAILVLEACAFGTGFAAASETGTRVVGAIEGISGLAVVGVAAVSDRESGQPEFTVPYGVGLLALSYYNFASASSQTRERKLWTNVLGFHATVLASVLSAVILRSDKQSLNSLTLQVTSSSVRLNITF